MYPRSPAPNGGKSAEVPIPVGTWIRSWYNIQYRVYKELIVLGENFSFKTKLISQQFSETKTQFNWGLAVRKKSDRILKLLEKGSLLKEERDRARKLTRGIQGFGSLCQRSSAKGILRESSRGTFDRCNSQFTNFENEENQLPFENEGGLIQKVEKVQYRSEESSFEPVKRAGNSSSWGSCIDEEVLRNPKTQTSFKENMVPSKEESHGWHITGESIPLIESKNDENQIGNLIEDDHPFSETENQTNASLLSARDGILQGC
ncbi:hypothetical protein CUMW_050080 [Citrus unshiu]|nr:hypothetical protein CUMW_050080 [Citrus unshiu]